MFSFLKTIKENKKCPNVDENLICSYNMPPENRGVNGNDKRTFRSSTKKKCQLIGWGSIINMSHLPNMHFFL